MIKSRIQYCTFIVGFLVSATVTFFYNTSFIFAEEDAVTNAWLKKEKAQDQYYQALKKEKNLTPERRNQLKAEILDQPTKEFKDATAAARKKAGDRYKREDRILNLPEYIKDPKSFQISPESSSPVQSKPSKKSPREKATADGTGVPKVVEFKGKKSE